jgi:hypothetical protein
MIVVKQENINLKANAKGLQMNKLLEVLLGLIKDLIPDTRVRIRIPVKQEKPWDKKQ